MTDAPKTVATRSIVVEWQLGYPMHKVWRAITDSALIARWLMDNDFEPVVGHHFHFRAQPVPGWDGVVHCEVYEVDVPKKLVYSWAGGADNKTGYGSRLDTLVSWTLTQTADGGTHVRLVHSGFTDKDSFAFETMGKGWRGKIAEQLANVVASLT